MRRTILTFLCLLLVEVTQSEEAETQTFRGEIVRGSDLVKSVVPTYPNRELAAGAEGWVAFRYMIDKAGIPYDIVVVDAVGSKGFHKNAREAISRTRYKPQKTGGSEGDRSSFRRVIFQITGFDESPTYSRRFHSRLKALNSALRKGNEAGAKRYLTDLGNTRKTLFEHALYWTARFNFNVRWGTPLDQLVALDRAVVFKESANFLPPETYENLLWAQLNLRVKLNRLSSAESSAERLLKRSDLTAERTAQLKQLLATIDKNRVESDRIVVEGKVNELGVWWFSLFMSKFAIGESDGKITELALFCDGGVLRLEYDSYMMYDIQQNYKNCRVLVEGEPGTRFKLVEFGPQTG